MADDHWSDAGKAQSRIALFGGSFDPPHSGHVAIAHSAANAFNLDCVIFTPTGLQPLKRKGSFATYSERLDMVRLMCAPEPRFVVSELDTPRSDGKPNYTVNTLEALRRLHPEARLFAIAGADSFLEMPGWYRSEDLLALAEWIVVSRPGFSVSGTRQHVRSADPESRVHHLNNLHNTISATELRLRLAHGEDCSDSIPASVMKYITQHQLYRH